MVTRKIELLLARLVLRLRSQRGASLTEYALLVSLIAATCLGAIEFLGAEAAAKLSAVGNSIGQP